MRRASKSARLLSAQESRQAAQVNLPMLARQAAHKLVIALAVGVVPPIFGRAPGGGRRLLRKEVIHVSLSPCRGEAEGVDHLERRLDRGTRLTSSSLGHDNGGCCGKPQRPLFLLAAKRKWAGLLPPKASLTKNEKLGLLWLRLRRAKHPPHRAKRGGEDAPFAITNAAIDRQFDKRNGAGHGFCVRCNDLTFIGYFV